MQVRFVRPELTAEVDFRAWTADGLLRQASFQGLREDKPAREITRETTMAVDVASERPKSNVKLTHPDRVYWPDVGVTKEGLADYYAEVWRFIAPFIVGRPLALVRCPDGVGGQTFFQKHAWAGLNPNIALVNDPADPSGEALISIRDFDGLVALAQSAALEIHPWGSTIADWERPDTLVMDLDPGEDVAWTSVIAAAEDVRGRLKSAGLVAFVKTSGGKGLHVVAPVKPKAEWPAAKAFAKSIADAMAADNPELYVSTIPKARRHGKILIDYLRNQRGMTAVAAYSTRARPGAPVSMPLAWNELSPGIGPAYFTIQNTPTRLASLAADPWGDFRAAAAPIEAPRSAQVVQTTLAQRAPDMRRRRRGDFQPARRRRASAHPSAALVAALAPTEAPPAAHPPGLLLHSLVRRPAHWRLLRRRLPQRPNAGPLCPRGNLPRARKNRRSREFVGLCRPSDVSLRGRPSRRAFFSELSLSAALGVPLPCGRRLPGRGRSIGARSSGRSGAADPASSVRGGMAG